MLSLVHSIVHFTKYEYSTVFCARWRAVCNLSCLSFEVFTET